MTSLFGQKSLTDLVRGIRSNKKNESQYISQALQEIKDELRSPDAQKKTIAIQKLTYLQMLGYDMSWAAFNVIEVMSQPKFTPKRIGYLAASQSYNDKTEVITLVTNLIRKDMTSNNVWEAGVALNCLANICTTDLARDLAADVVNLLNSSRPYVRKKACLVLYKVFLKFPDALRPAFPRLKEKLEDADPSVVAAAVNVICELARKNPKNYISLSPTLFKILTTSQNNWVLIKVVKLFSSLMPIEPRLGPKLVQPLNNLINNTPAVSLLYECIQACTIGLSDHVPTIKLCIQKLRNFVEDPDQNLKYLGLLSLGNIMKIHPKAVSEHRDLVVNCLDDDDITIRLRALDLLEGMVTKKNVLDIVRRLLDQIEKADQQAYKDAIVEKIMSICSKNSYQHITDFEWYISVLVELAHVPNNHHGEAIAAQLMDVVIRVQVVRPFAVKSMASLLREPVLAENPTKGGSCEVLYAAGYLLGEYAPNVEDATSVIDSLMQSRVVELPAHIQSVFIQAAVKLFAAMASSSGPVKSKDLISTDETADVTVTESTPQNGELDSTITTLKSRFPLFTQSQHLEVQERACFALELVNLFSELRGQGMDISSDLVSLFDEPLNPVNTKAQKKIPVPEDLDLDNWINEPEPEPQISEYEKGGFDFISKYDYDDEDDVKSTGSQPSAEEKKTAGQAARPSSVWILGSGQNTPASNHSAENVPVVALSAEDLGLKSDNTIISHKERIMKAKPKRSAITVLKDEDLPPGTSADDDEDDKKEKEYNPFANINLNEPLRAEERLPVATHRTAAVTKKEDTKATKKTKKSAKKEPTGKTKKSKAGAKKKPEAESANLLIDLEPTSTAPTETSTSLPGFEELGGPSETVTEKPKKKKATTKKETTKTTKTAKTAKTTKSAAPAAPVTEKAAPKPVPKFKPLCQDDNLSIIYELRVNPKQAKKIMTAFAFKNLSQHDITNIEFSLPATMNAKISNENSAKVNFVLHSGDTNNHSIIFDIVSIQNSFRIGGQVSYDIDGFHHKKDFQLLIPVSAYVLPIKLAKEEFIQVLTQEKMGVSSSQLKLDQEFNLFIVSLATLLHVELIIFETAASFYGKTIQGHHVAVYSKPTAAGVVTVDVKCTDATIATSLIAEVNNFFPRV